MTSDTKLDSHGIQLEILKTIDQIYLALKKPWDFDTTKHVNAISSYRDSEGKTHFSKLMRNNMFSQRLFRMRDEVNEAVCRIEISKDKLILKTNKKEADSFVKAMELTHISENVFRASVYYLNALSYFFDFPVKDNAFNQEEIINFTHMRNSKLGNSITSVVDSKDYKLVKSVYEELDRGYFGVPIIESDADKKVSIHTAHRYQQDEIVDSSINVLNCLKGSLEVLLSEIVEKYETSLGYSSVNDIVVKEDKDTKAWIGSVYSQQPELFPFKIFNFWDARGLALETPGYYIVRNFRYKQSLEGKYRSSDHKTHTFKYKSDEPTKAVLKVDKAQEGSYVWTHTLEFKKHIVSKSYKKHALEDACLTLSWVTGSGVYGDDSASSYSHKAKGDSKYSDIEIAFAFTEIAKLLRKAPKDDRTFYKLILSRYRQALQPSSTNGRLVKLWELIDVIGDFYCSDTRKELPTGYENHEKLRKTILEGLTKLEKELSIPLTGDGGYTPIFIDKSIGSKVNDLLIQFKIAELAEVSPSELKKSVRKVYGLRSKLTHSSVSDFKDRKNFYNLINTYFFISDILFLIISQVFKLPESDSLKSIQLSVKGFVLDDNYYINRHRQIKKQGRKIDDMFKIISGEKPWPKGKKIITF